MELVLAAGGIRVHLEAKGIVIWDGTRAIDRGNLKAAKTPRLPCMVGRANFFGRKAIYAAQSESA